MSSSTSPRFPIPPDFQHALRSTTPRDIRTNEELLKTLSTHKPVRSEKNIWAFWDTGIRHVRPWQQRNVCD